MKKLNYETKTRMVELAGNCFWYWDNFYSFLESCSVPRNIYQRYPKESFKKFAVMRNVLSDLELNNRVEIISELISGFYRLSTAVDSEVQNPEKAKKLLREFKQHVGQDPIQRELEKIKAEEVKERYQSNISEIQIKSKKLLDLNSKFTDLLTSSVITPQKKGFEFERLFFEILSLEEFEYEKPFRNSIEQIDGRFKFEKFDYLVEIKFESEPITQDSLAAFDNKIKGKAQSTRGFFLAANGFKPDHLVPFKGNSPRLILMDGSELPQIFEGRKSFYDLFQKKVDQLIKSGEIFYKSTI